MKNTKADLTNANEVLEEERTNWAWCHMTLIPALGKLRQKNIQFEASLSYMVSSR